jgi:hypothetical protein
MLRQKPRADMAGFEPCDTDRARWADYAARQEAEARNRKALREGQKEYDG